MKLLKISDENRQIISDSMIIIDSKFNDIREVSARLGLVFDRDQIEGSLVELHKIIRPIIEASEHETITISDSDFAMISSLDSPFVEALKNSLSLSYKNAEHLRYEEVPGCADEKELSALVHSIRYNLTDMSAQPFREIIAAINASIVEPGKKAVLTEGNPAVQPGSPKQDPGLE